MALAEGPYKSTEVDADDAAYKPAIEPKTGGPHEDERPFRRTQQSIWTGDRSRHPIFLAAARECERGGARGSRRLARRCDTRTIISAVPRQWRQRSHPDCPGSRHQLERFARDRERTRRH